MTGKGEGSSPGRRELVGRIPGTPGLWAVACEGARIVDLTCRDPSFDEVRCRWITPGLFDLQINGIAGINVTSPDLTPGDLARMDLLVRQKGISRYCPTLITCSPETARAALAAFRTAGEQGKLCAAWGVHLEGPWISSEDGYRGIHRRQFACDPDPRMLDALQEAAGGGIRVLTLAPERPGALEMIRHAAAKGILVSLGHTNASPTEIAAAAEAGARMSTHLFNGCAPLLGRHSNVVYSQLAEDSLYACFIADGHHIPFPTLRIGMRAKGPGRPLLVSDIAHLSGLPDGEYEMEGSRVVLRDGGLRVKETGLLSGAARTLDQDVELLARQPEPGIEQALLMATAVPAAASGDPAWARLRAGREGPLAVFSWDGERLLLEERLGF